MKPRHICDDDNDRECPVCAESRSFSAMPRTHRHKKRRR